MIHSADALITGPKHFGSKRENPTAFASLELALNTLGKTVPTDAVYAYDSDGFTAEFDFIAHSLCLDPDVLAFSPDEDEVLSLGFVKVGTAREDTIYQLGAVIFITGEDATSVFIVI